MTATGVTGLRRATGDRQSRLSKARSEKQVHATADRALRTTGAASLPRPAPFLTGGGAASALNDYRLLPAFNSAVRRSVPGTLGASARPAALEATGPREDGRAARSLRSSYKRSSRALAQ